MISEEERLKWIDTINSMGQEEMARMYRFAPSGHPVFDTNNNLFDIFMERFKKQGGMTSTVSKRIGWE